MLQPSSNKVIIRLPQPHEHQRVFLDWSVDNPSAQCLIAPCGSKVGKTFGSALWFLTEMMSTPGLYGAWIAPTYLKCRIGYRYIKAMADIDQSLVKFIDGRLEVKFANGSFIKFLHGRDAETVIEGEAVDRFCIDESGKISRQVFHSLLTTITQTQGRGICTGTPRGFTWYYDMFKRAQDGDPFFVWAQIPTSKSPYVTPEALAQNERLLPKHLYAQYFLAQFVSMGTVFGDITTMIDENIEVEPGPLKFWLHPDLGQRTDEDVVHGVDLARNNDWTVFYSVNSQGRLVGFVRFRQVAYTLQVQRLKQYIDRYFSKCDNLVRFDATGVGVAVGDMFAEADIDAAITPVTFTQKSKAEMVTRTIMAIETGWHKAPRIPAIEHEFASYELKVTKTGLHSYSAPDGEHDDIVSSAILAISAAFQSTVAESAERVLEQTISGNIENEQSDIIAAYANIAAADDEFFDGDSSDKEFEFDEANA